jgi:hypothetical protein
MADKPAERPLFKDRSAFVKRTRNESSFELQVGPASWINVTVLTPTGVLSDFIIREVEKVLVDRFPLPELAGVPDVKI